MANTDEQLRRIKAHIEQELRFATENVKHRQDLEDKAQREGDEQTRLGAENSLRYWRGQYDALFKVAQAAGVR